LALGVAERSGDSVVAVGMGGSFCEGEFARAAAVLLCTQYAECTALEPGGVAGFRTPFRSPGRAGRGAYNVSWIRAN